MPGTPIFAERDGGQNTSDGFLEGGIVPCLIQPTFTPICLAGGSTSAYLGHTFSSTSLELNPRAGSKYAHHSKLDGHES